MKKFSTIITFLMVVTIHAPAATLYVNLNSTNPEPPYATWSTAATNIQDAIDASSDGDLILVTNGVYQTGGRTANGYALTNRVVIDKAVTVQSVNGPAFTSIEGYQVPGTLLGSNAIRCVYMTNDVALMGFTLTNGATMISGDNIHEESGGGIWCESSNAVISNCVIIANSCYYYGAGVYGGTLIDCQINGNTNQSQGSFGGGGGGAAYSALSDCTVESNFFFGVEIMGGGSGGYGSAGGSGGAFSCSLSNCVICGNSWGGVGTCTLEDCTIENNTNTRNGGGAVLSTLTNCFVCNNAAGNSSYGGGVYDCALNDCTISNNWANRGGGIYYDGYQTNAPGQNNIVIGNKAAFNGGGLWLELGYSTPNWNINDWMFVSNSAAGDGGGVYVTATVPLSIIKNCTFSGNSSGRSGGGLSGPYPYLVAAASNCTFTGNVAVGNGGGAYCAAVNDCYLVENKGGNGGGIYGIASNCVFNNNVATTNGGGLYYYSGSLPQSVVVACDFTNNFAVNGGGACEGIFSNCTFSANLAVTNGGGTSTAALNNCLVVSNRADFGGGACLGGDSVPIYPGAYGTYVNSKMIGNSANADGGGTYAAFPVTMTNCVIAYNYARNNGGGAFMGTLGGCTVTGNTAGDNGGGVCEGNLSYCIVSGNAAGTNGGGDYNGILSFSYVTNNDAGDNGGGAYGSSIVNCLFAGNAATSGGGACNGTIGNSTIAANTATNAGGGVYFVSGGGVTSCIIYNNAAPADENYSGYAAYNYCCTTPLPPVGNSNITNNPVFVDFAAGNFRLQTNSPCINAGSGSPGQRDLDGRPRVVGGRIDVGAYEFQSPGVGEFTAWLQKYGLPTDGSADYTDTDNDGMNNYQEWVAGTNPTNDLSLLEMLNPVLTNNPAGLLVSWQSVSNRTYFLQSSTNLATQPAFSTIQTNIFGSPTGTNHFTDTSATNAGPYFYRVGVQ